MNKRYLASMRGGMVRLYPAPFLVEERKYLRETHWRVTNVGIEGKAVWLCLETLSGALGLVLRLCHDSIIGFDYEDLHYSRNITQGVFRLKDQWFLPARGPWRRVPIQREKLVMPLF